MKVSLILEVTDRADLKDVAKAAIESVLSGDDDGTYGMSGMGEYTIARWAPQCVECLSCGGSGFTL